MENAGKTAERDLRPRRAVEVDSRAADAILERTRLWPGDATQHAQSAEDFETLGEQMATRRKGKLSAEDRTERDNNLAESRRFHQIAEEMSRHSPHDNLRVER